MVVSAAGQTRALGSGGVADLPATERRAIVLRALSGEYPAAPEARASGLQDVYIPGLFEFVKQLERFRHCIVDELSHLHRDVSHQTPLLLAPAMVDFGRWLRDDPDKGSTFADQVTLWGEISRRPGGPAVHGYVSFCPLRQVQYRLNRFGTRGDQIQTACGDVEPLALVEEALTKHGFIGVKFYPPMGFRAATNAARGPDDHPYPDAVLADVFGHSPRDHAETVAMSADLGAKLDQAMLDVAAVCRRHGACMMAHGGNSVGANCDTGELADPFYWKPLFDLPDAPPIMLAHFGSFSYWSADPNAPGHEPAPGGRCEARSGIPPFENTWEAWLARFVEANPDKPVFADISYFSEALSAGTEADAAANFKLLESHNLTAIRSHLVFGTDWVMLAQEKNAQVYSERVREFIRQVFGDAWVDPIMRTNFLRFASLKDPATFRRIAAPYQGDRTLEARLAAACA
jgi:hypothetical protein